MHPDQPPLSSTVTARYARWLIRWRWPVLVVSLVLALAAGAGASRPGFIDEYRVFFGPNNPQLLAFDELENIYTQNDNILFVIEPADGNAFSRATPGDFSTKGDM